MTEKRSSTIQSFRVAFLNCFDAKLFSADIKMTAAEYESLGAALAWLQDAGVLLLPSQCDVPERLGAEELLTHLRATVGDHIVEAALAADPDLPRASGPVPAAVLPVWPFEAEGDDPEDRDVLLASGRLWGADVLLEALRVADPDNPEPVCQVRSRFDRWVKAAGGGKMRAVIHPPGENGSYFLAAIAAPI